MAEFIKSSRGGTLLVFNDFYYRCKQSKGNIKYWRCSNKQCSATMITENEDLKKINNIHDHGPQKKDILKKKFTENLKADARANIGVPVPTLYNKHMVKAVRSDASSAPSFDKVKSSVYRALASDRPQNPKSAQDVDIKGEWTKTINGSNFLLIDKKEKEGRILVFGTLENIKKLCSSEKIFVDGTFKVVPPHFKQLYTVHGKYLGQVFPFLYCLMESKSMASYKHLFSSIAQFSQQNNALFPPKMAMMDFETSAMKAIEAILPSTKPKGCLFHYTQCIMRKVQKSGLFTLYRNDINVHRWIRRIAALPLVPVESIRDVFIYIEQNAPQIPQAMVIHQYLKKTWLGQMGNAAIDVEIWNHFLNESERTNNHVEGFHSKLNKRAGKPHLELYRFIELLKEIQEENEVTMIMLQTGSKEPPKMKIKYQKINEKLADLKRKLLNNSLNVYEYTDQVGYLLHLED